MSTEQEIKDEICNLYKKEIDAHEHESERLKESVDWSLSCAFLFSDKTVDPLIYIDDDLNFCFDFILKNRYLSISVKNNIYYYALVYIKKKDHGKANLNTEIGDNLLKELIDSYFKDMKCQK